MTTPLVLGIDFGTCRTSAAVRIGSELHSVTFGSGDSKNDMPTAVFVESEGHFLVGEDAEKGMLRDPSRFFERFKPDLGKQGHVHAGSIEMEYRDLVATVLERVRLTAQNKLNNDKPIVSACITVPTLYVEDGDAWTVMEDAAKQAGFENVRLVREPHAAAIYYDSLLKRDASVSNADQVTLVYDLGGGTFDPALIQRCKGDYRILGAISGEEGVRCGGIYFDEAIREDFARKCPGVLDQMRFDPAGDASTSSRRRKFRDIQDLREMLQQAKIHLSQPGVETYRGNEPTADEEYILTRLEFEGMISPLLDATLECCDALVRRTGLEWSRIDRILMVGGSCHIPLVRKKLEAFAKSRGASPEVCWRRIGTTDKFYEPMLAVSYGAAMAGRMEELAEGCIERHIASIADAIDKDAIVANDWPDLPPPPEVVDFVEECFGNTETWYANGEMYRTGQGCTVDMVEAAKWYRKAAEGGLAAAQFHLGYLYANGQGVPKDNGEAFWWYTKAAEQGDSSAQCNLGLCYHDGQGVGIDPDKAKYWYMKAIAQGDETAKRNLALLETQQVTNYGLLDGSGRIAQEKHEDWFARAERYRTGNSVEKDLSEAVTWYRKAAEAGNPKAQCNLGASYQNGHGIARDVEEAKLWYRKAIAQGSEKAKRNLALLESPPSSLPSMLSDNAHGIVRDPRDNREYRIVMIGSQIWMAQNLAFDAPGSACYGDRKSNITPYGRLYDWQTAQMACLPGWHIPSDQEWNELARSVSMDARRLKSRTGWGESKNLFPSEDEPGFCARPGGFKQLWFRGIGHCASFWSSTKTFLGMNANIVILSHDSDKIKFDSTGVASLYSVRCVKDTP